MERRPICIIASLIVLLAVGFAFPGQISAQNNYEATGAEVEFGDTFLSQILFDLEDDAQGFSLAFCFDDSNLELIEVANGDTLATSNHGGPPGFYGINLDPPNGTGVTLGVIIDLMGPGALQAGTDLEILDVTFTAIGDPGSSEIVTEIEFCDTLGDPVVLNSLVIGSETVVPDLIDGVVTIVPPPPYCFCDLVCTGGLDQTSLQWSYATEFDYVWIFKNGELIDELDPTDPTPGFSDLDLGPGTYYYSLLGLAFPDFTEPAIVVSENCSATVIPLVLSDFTPKTGPYGGGTEITLTGLGFQLGENFTVEIGDQTAEDIVVVDGNTATCITPPVDFIGEVEVFVSHSLGEATAVDKFLYGFIRGDFNEDTLIDIADPVYLLEYLFTQGPHPGCDDALDANDDEEIDVGDPIYLLNYLFNSVLPPPAPFPEAGVDPTRDDDFGCLNKTP